MRDGESRDRTVADQLGQFVMVPSRLPPGNYELTLRSSLPNGKQATSKQRVPVRLSRTATTRLWRRRRLRMHRGRSAEADDAERPG